MQSNRVLLLDVDGVLVRNKALTNSVKRRSIQHVAKSLKVSTKEAVEINKLLYSNYGHTAIGLEQMYGLKNAMQFFNDSVYDRSLLDAMAHIVHNKKGSDESIRMKIVLWRCFQHKVPVFLFSNAPHAWCSQLLNSNMISNEILPDEYILSGDHPLLSGRLKPTKGLYDAALTFVRMAVRNDTAELVFVDDSLVNLLPIMNKPGDWIPVRFDGQGPILHSPRIREIQRLDQLLPVLFTQM